MKKGLMILAGCALLFGGGCTSFIPSSGTVTPSSSIESGTPSPEGLIGFRQGFGLLPGKNPLPADRPASNVDVSWKELPEVPYDVTVIRKRNTLPNTTVLENLTSSMNIPIGVFQLNPRSESLAVAWQDTKGYRWSYDAGTDRLSFERIRATPSLTAALPAKDEVLQQTAANFLNNHGVLSSELSAPYLVYSWDAWWSTHIKEGKCMSGESIKVVRTMAEKSSLDFDLLSSLLPIKSGACINPEFPNLQVVRFSMSQDGDTVFTDDGTPYIAAEAVVSSDTEDVLRGFVELKRDADRSNYMAILPDRLKTYLKQGGVSGFPANAKSYQISAFTKGEYRYEGEVDDVKRIFYIPAIQATGILTYQNGTSIPYSIVVPLTREDQFVGR